LSSSKSPEEIRKLHQEYLARQKLVELKEGLPFLHGWKWYPWAKEFFLSSNRINLLCAANQISKSSTQIRKCIDWATNTKKWPTLWLHTPKQFWYLYPTAEQATIEFEQKWKQFLPKGKFKDHPIYGWTADITKKEGIKSIHFNTGVTVYFKTYSQNAMALQTGTVDAMFCDEELPEELYEELMFRLSASDGYFHMVFTATLGQNFWRLCMEPEQFETEALPNAWKRSISLYDAQFYEDGSPSHWTEEKINIVKNRCRNHKEVLKRVFGRFVRDDSGRKYEQFDVKRHLKPRAAIPREWSLYAGVDPGTGGTRNHPGAVCFVAVSPDHTRGRVIAGWRGDGIETTAEDIYRKFKELAKQVEYKFGLEVTECFYDWGSKDFQIIQGRDGGAFQPADKSHERGEQIINVLFKNDMMVIEDDEELHKLATELVGLRKETPKNKAKDDFCDAFRYAVTRIPWDFSKISSRELVDPDAPLSEPEGPPLSPIAQQIQERREYVAGPKLEPEDENPWTPESEITEWNELYGNDF